jgi:hypothetical protein
MAKKSAQIIEIKKMMGKRGLVIIYQVGIDALWELRETCNGIEDKRFQSYVEHLLPNIVMISLLAVTAQANE